MNGHDQPDRHRDDILPGELIPEDSQDLAGGRMETHTRVTVTGGSTVGAPMIDKVEATGLGQNGMLESIDVNLTYALGCHHVLHVGGEAGALCADGCGRLICATCAAKEENLCHACRRPVAGPCQQRPWLAGDGQVFCRRCWWRWWARELVIAGGIAFGVLILLAALRCAIF